MAEQSSDQDTRDFASLTDAIIPSNIYLNSWSPTVLPTSSETHTFPSSFNMFGPTFGGIFPLQNSTGNPITPIHTAFRANSLQQFDPATQNQDREIETVRASTGQHSQSAAPPLHSEISESKARAISTKDPLASLKMRAKESVMAKRVRSIRSASNDSKTSPADIPGQDLTHKGGSNNVVQDQESDSKSRFCTAGVHALSFPSSESLLQGHQSSAKATSAELEDLLAEGRAAASLAKAPKEHNHSATEQRGRHGDIHQHCEGGVSEAGEIQDHIGRRVHEATTHHSPRKSGHFSADVMDEIDVWLGMTGYYDKPYRDKVLNRHRRLKEIEEERSKLLEEERDDQRLRGQFHSTTPFYTPTRPTPPVATICPPPSTTTQDVGLRIKNSALKKLFTPEETSPNDEAPVKRRLEEETTDGHAQYQSKVARTEVRRRTPPRSQRASPERRPNRSISPGSNKKDSATSSRGQSPHLRDGYDRWVPEREIDHRGLMDRSLGESARRNDYRGRYDQRRDSGFGTSHPLKPDLRAGRVRFFLLKSWNYENIATAQKEGTWATQTKNEEAFVEAFKTCRHVIFFFSANHSKAFQGYARMQGLPGERGVEQPSWVKNLHWPTTEPFRIKWIVKEETPYRAVGNIKNPLNENLAVFVGRDGQEIPEKLGLQLSEIIDEDTAYRADFRR